MVFSASGTRLGGAPSFEEWRHALEGAIPA
jgi:hypothetical protein